MKTTSNFEPLTEAQYREIGLLAHNRNADFLLMNQPEPLFQVGDEVRLKGSGDNPNMIVKRIEWNRIALDYEVFCTWFDTSAKAYKEKNFIEAVLEKVEGKSTQRAFHSEKTRTFKVFSASGQMQFCLSDESVTDSRGGRILVSGIDLDRFKKNPVLFYNHNYQNIPIGKWQNISVVNGLLLGTPIFDENDTLGKIVKQKIDEGFLNACSVGIIVKEESDDNKYKIAGQTKPTILKSELIEVSIVDIPANKNAVRILNQA